MGSECKVRRPGGVVASAGLQDSKTTSDAAVGVREIAGNDQVPLCPVSQCHSNEGVSDFPF